MRPSPTAASHSSITAHAAPPACGSRSPEASRWQESRHRPSRGPPPRRLDQRRELLERAPERAAGARRVLEVQRAALGLGERRAMTSPARSIAGADVARLRRAGVQRPRRARRSRRRRAANGSATRAIFSRISRVLGGAVEQVDRVDQHGADLARRERLAEAREVLLAVARSGARHPRRLVEDLDRAAAQLRCRARPRGTGRPRVRRGRRLASGTGHESPLRSFTHRRAAHRRRAHGAVQLAARARRRRALRAADRRYRPRALDARERRADPRRAALARARLGRGPDLPVRARASATARRSRSCWRAGAPTTRRRRPTTCAHGRSSTATTAASAASPSATGAVRLRVPDEGDDRVRRPRARGGQRAQLARSTTS